MLMSFARMDGSVRRMAALRPPLPFYMRFSPPGTADIAADTWDKSLTRGEMRCQHEPFMTTPHFMST
jgi:hypothetical protein